jgi:hypothetical protein
MNIKAMLGAAVVLGVLALSHYIGWQNALAITLLVTGLTALFIVETGKATRY